MGTIWFIVALVFFLLWIFKKSKPNSNDSTVDLTSKNYAQGYWDGYRAHQKGLTVDQTITPIDDIEINDNDIAVGPIATNVQQQTVNLIQQKEKHDLQNINTTLYVASFLLVAAAALFIGTTLPEVVRFIGVWFIVVLFYVAGLVLHETVDKLRPAAIAFVGTGLAVLPFTGIAMYNFVIQDAAVCWLATSIIGLLAFIFAAARLRSQVVAYLAIAFGVSLVTSSVAILHVGLLWYFVVSIAFGAIMTFISRIKPAWVSSSFAKPIQESNNWIVPLTIVASLFAFTGMSLMDYWVISLISATYYGAVAVSSVSGRDVAVLLARLLVSLAVVLMVYDYSDSFTLMAMAISIIGVVQLTISVIFLPIHISEKNNNEIWLWLGLIMLLLAPIIVLVDQDNLWASIISSQLLVLIIISFCVSYLLRRTIIACFGTVALAILPIVWGLNVVVPALEMQWLALIFVGLGAIGILFRSLVIQINIHPEIRSFFVANVCMFILEALMFTINNSYGWKFSIWLSASLLLYIFVYIERQPWATLFANALFIVASYWLVKLYGVDPAWLYIAVSWIVFVVFYLAYWIMTGLSRKEYGMYFWWSAIVAAGLINLVSLTSMDDTIAKVAVTGSVGVASLLVIKGWSCRQYMYINAGVILATIGLQRLMGLELADINILVYTHWWSLVFAGLSYLYYSVGNKKDSKTLIYFSLVIMSLFSGMAALGSFGVSDVPYQTIFLLEHLLLLIIGLVVSRKLFTVWGAVGAVLSVLWTMKDQTYLLLASAALVLIGVAVYALVRKSKGVK